MRGITGQQVGHARASTLINEGPMIIGYLPFPDIGTEIFALELGGFRLALRWYALAYIVGLFVGWRICAKTISRADFWAKAGPPFLKRQLEDLFIWIVAGVIIGGRLGFVLFYQPEYYLQNPLEILMVWQGGMSFHGGFLGVVLSTLIFCHRQGIAVLPTADLLAIATPPGLFLGRVANFTNNELWGRPTDLPWGVAFPGEVAQACPGVVGVCARHPSQLYEAILEGLILGALLLFLAWRRGWLRTPGRLTGVFLLGYGSSRVFVEFFRQPDMQFVTPDNPIGYALLWGNWGITMGQSLSVPMILIGVVLILWPVL
jgi:phosphatidylglycerol:prolipoprotein diacylglycerol transferase